MIGTKQDIINYLNKNYDDKVLYKLEEHKDKRSLNANNYMWSLIQSIANVVRATKEEVYINLLDKYGQSDVISVVADVDVEQYFKYYKMIGESTLNGKRFKHYRIIKGSSEYNTKEMSILLDGVISDCKELGIETLTPNEILEMKARWKS